MPEILYSSTEVAALVGKAASTVKQLARTHDIGRIVGHSRVFTEEDIERLRALPGPGRPRTPKPPQS